MKRRFPLLYLSISGLLAMTVPLQPAAQDALYVTTTGVGVGTDTPSASLHVLDATIASWARVRIEDENIGDKPGFQIASPTISGTTDNNRAWSFESNTIGQFQINHVASPGAELVIDDATGTVVIGSSVNTADLIVTGSISSGGAVLNVPDYVFKEDYALMPIEELATFIKDKNHLPNIPSAAEIEREGAINLSEFQMALLEKIEELTLYTVQQEQKIKELAAYKLQQEEKVNSLQGRLNALENTARPPQD